MRDEEKGQDEARMMKAILFCLQFSRRLMLAQDQR